MARKPPSSPTAKEAAWEQFLPQHWPKHKAGTRRWNDLRAAFTAGWTMHIVHASVPKPTSKTGLDNVRTLADRWKWRAGVQNLPMGSKRRDNACLDYFLGAASHSYDSRGINHPITIALIKVSSYVISLRGERGLDEYLNPPKPGRR